MKTVIIQRQIEAQQYMPGIGAPDGCIRSHPEVCWAVGREYVYFTFANLRSGFWMGTKKLDKKPEKVETLESFSIISKEGKDLHVREILSFAYWSLKSEASVSGDYKAVFLNAADETEVELFQDYALISKWMPDAETAKRLQTTIEFREVNGALGRGYRPHYMEPGDWLLKETVDGKVVYSVVNNEMFEKLQAK
jgi:hypothetical protein